ncbi:MAG: 2OG-Fe dioxygenase family protein [Proteobacteria bacterium]|nr:2OG-Fe dioxygenase family protein [Pseudomonadota bacterium]
MDQARRRMLASLELDGYAFAAPAEAAAALQLDLPGLDALTASWDALPRDAYLRDGGAYRSRRHSCFTQDAGGAPQPVAHRPHWQPTAYNALHGGLTRWFEAVDAAVRGAPAWGQLLGALGALFAQRRAVPRWYIEAHQFRIDTHSGIGRPTPEGAHRDGVDFVAVVLVARQHVTGGETRVFDAHGSSGVRFTMAQPWSMLLMDDARVIHETTPIQPDGAQGWRDTLVLTYRSQGFQSPEGTAAG